jgi:hypothetical protein
MPSRLILPFALAATIGAATPAAASCAAPCAPSRWVEASPAPAYVKRVHARRPHVKRYLKPIYIVEQGPVYSGPAILTTPRFVRFNTRLAHYPVMRETYSYPTYRDSYTVPPWHRPEQDK